MGSKSIRDGNSPSNSTLLLPQLRSSRRGSFASLSSTTQIDKETLSQVLDQIHSTASQSETLTTFNEYTSPPSSSSGPDSKGIASELQGGFSGLYTRLRASVGHVKDVVNFVGEDAVGETITANGLEGPLRSPAPSIKSDFESSRVAGSSAALIQGSSVSGSGRQSPVGTKFTNTLRNEEGQNPKPSKISLGGASASSKSISGSLAALKSPPATLTQATQATTISPALAEVNISAVKQLGSSAPLSSSPKGTIPPNSHNCERSAPTHTLGDNTTKGDGKPSPTIPLGGHGIKRPGNGPLNQQFGESYQAQNNLASAGLEGPSGGREPERSTSQVSEDTVQPFPGLEADEDDENAIASSSDADDDRDGPPRIVTTQSNVQGGVFNASDKTNGNAAKSDPTRRGGYQHLELPLRRTMAAPLITSSHSPNSSLSRASSSDTNGESLANSPLHRLSQPEPARHHDLSQTKGGNPQSVASPSGVNRDLRTMNVFSQVKNKVLNKEYWMKDENARDCFYCGDPFSTFRRKHHCRTCGQIFDSKCTSLISGDHFAQSGSLRVCKPCEGIIYGEDDSSEFSDDGNLSIRGVRPRHGSTGASDVLGSPIPESSPIDVKGPPRSPKHLELSVPTMSIPATRKAGGHSSRKPTVLEIDAERTLARPSSSRSLKSSFANKPYYSAHRRHNSRHLLQRGFKPVHEDSAPFHQNPIDEKGRTRRLPAFHDDNIIDPDLAPYLSDEESSGDEQMSIMAALSGDGLSRSHENERHGFSGLLASSKKARSRTGDKSISGVTFASRDADSHSLSSLKTGTAPRSLKRRNLSVTGNAHSRPSPRNYRANLATPNFGMNLHENPSGSTLVQATASGSPAGGSRMIRSSSMRGAAAPAVELNNASLRHVRKLLHQLLEDSNVPNIVSWEKALIPILLRATDDVNPDVQNGDDIDIRHYVKLKKIPGGRPGDTSYVSGLVFTKNLALKCMPRSISHPNILILTFPLEYARHQLHFMSLEPVIRQEREFLQNVVNRIAALRPQLLLVERNVSGLALEFLQQANIATAYNVKASVLEAVSRCCQTKIISSIDKLAIKPAQAGKCASFYLKTYVNGGRKKTYIFLSGCAKELGCTIVLRGDNDATLAKMKRITEFMIYVVYNLKLETCLMRDEFASIPSNTEIGTLSPGRENLPRSFQGILSDPSKNGGRHAITVGTIAEGDVIQSNADIFNAELSKVQNSDSSETEKPNISLPDEDSVPDDIPMPTFYGDMVEEHKTKILSASPFVKFVQPYLLMRAREQERRLAYLKRLRDQDINEEQNLDGRAKPQKFDLIRPEMVHERVHTASRKVREVIHAVHDAEYDKALHNYQTQSRQWETYISGNINLFDPYAHQNIAVLYSLVCTATTVPCSGPDVLAFGFYNEHETDADFEADCTLGQYVEDLCLGGHTVCTANGCETKMFQHHRQYVHGEAQLSVFVEKHPCKLRGLQDTILMWSTCRICSKETQVLPMSESTWKYSFGKYLELSFWSTDMHARAGVCPHDIHRDHLRYFGFKDVALRVHYDRITLLEIIVPRARITWKVDNDLRFKNDLFTKIEDRLTKFMLSVKARIKSINTESVLPEKSDNCKQEVERLSKRASDEHLALIQKLRERYMNSKHYEIIPLNRAVREVQEKVAEWDNAFADFDQDFFPSEKDIRRLATLQLKKIFLDRDDSNASLASADDGAFIKIPEEEPNEKTANDDTPALAPQTRRMSPEKAHDMLAAVVERHVSIDGQPDKHQSAPATAVPILRSDQDSAPLQMTETEGVRHLDLAVPTNVTEELGDSQKTDGTGDRKPTQKVSGGNQTSEVIAKRLQKSPEASVNVNEDGMTVDLPALALSLEPSKTAEANQTSGIPRPVEASQRKTRSNVSPTLSRAQSQPAHLRYHKSTSSSSQSSSVAPQPLVPDSQSTKLGETLAAAPPSAKKPVDRKLSDRLGLGASKPSGVTPHSMIPRSIASRSTDSKVSNLAKHFEQLSREFEKERIRERRQRAAKSRQSRAYPMASSKPIVQVYANVHEAVEEREPSDEDLLSSDPSITEREGPLEMISHLAESTAAQTSAEGFHAEETTEENTAENTETEENNHLDSHVGSDTEGEGNRSDEDRSSILDDIQIQGVANEHHALSPEEAQLDLKLDLPKHEKSSLMKMLTNFWAERSASGWQPLEYPLSATDHIFADSDIIVREYEPSSLIAFALGSEDYQSKLRSITKCSEDIASTDHQEKLQGLESDHDQAGVEQVLLRPTGTHLKYQFAEGSAKMLCKVLYAEQFDALRRKCGVSTRIVESLSRCAKWDSKGGKTKSIFLKTLDDRFVLKSLSPIETQAFIKFAPAYFRIMSQSLFHDMPSVIAKMLGFYQVIIKNPVTGVDFNFSLLVMENLFYDRAPTRIFDLKGSMRNRRIQSTGEQNEVLLDENMVDFIYESPLFAREHSKRLLRASVFNDTLFLSKQNVMDYSLMVAIDENRKEIVVGIIDCIRTYTWDKKLESWIKDRGKNRPTVTSPKEYKSRFREAMARYVLQAPNCWHQFKAQQVDTRRVRVDEMGDDKEVQVVGM